MPNTISTACDFNHLLHPLSVPKKASPPGVLRRITGTGLLILSIPSTLGILTGLYLYWAHKKVVQINKEQTKAIDATVQQLFGKKMGTNNLQFVQTARSLYKGRTDEAFEQMKKLNRDNLLTPKAKRALAEAAIERNQLRLIEFILNEFNDIRDQFNDIKAPLHKAKTGAMVDRLIELGVKPDVSVDDEGNTALHCAANLEVAKALKAKGAKIFYNYKGLTPLHTCTNPEVALFLLAPEGYSMNANYINPKNPDILPAIFMVPLEVKKAMIKNDSGNEIDLGDLLHTCNDRKLAELLITKMDINQLDKSGNPPLFTVKDPEVLQLLIEKGANVRFTDDAGRCILHIKPLPENLLDLVIAKANETPGPDLLNLRDSRGVTPVFRDLSDEWKRLLIEKGASTNSDDEGNTLFHSCSTKTFAQFLTNRGVAIQANNWGETPLHTARTEEVANFLLEQGANINALNGEGLPPLMYTTQHWLIKLLINRGADLAIKDNQQRTILHLVNDPEIVKMLLAKVEVDPNAIDSKGNTALMVVSKSSWSHKETIQALAEKTTLKIANKQQLTAFHYLLKSGLDDDLFQLFIDRGADPKALDKEGNTLLSYCKTKEDAQKLIALGVNPKQTNSKGQTAIFHAVSADTVDYLVNECGVDINQKDDEGRIPLHTCKDSETFQWMIEYGLLDPNARDNQRQTPLHAQCAEQDASIEIVSLLIDKLALVNVQDNQGRTPLHLCKKSLLAKWYLIERGHADQTLTDNSGKTAEILKDPFFS